MLLGPKPLKSLLNSIINRFNKKLASWKGANLSQVGKCTLLKSTLINLPTYALSLFGILVKHANKMEKICRAFLWIGVEENKRYHLVAWDNAYLPKWYGGLGIRKMRHLNNALLGKKRWHIF